MTGKSLKIAVNGCGVAGPTLAWWLRHYGHHPVLLEKAPVARTGGYVIDFWGFGFEVAERMGLLPSLMQDGYVAERLTAVNRNGRTVSTLNAKVFNEMADGRYVSLTRSDLAARIFDACDGIETRFGTHVTGLHDTGAAVDVTLNTGATETFDLVVGADGLHSAVREIAFGPEDAFERHTGNYVAAFTVPGYRPRDELSFITHAQPGVQVSRFALRGDVTLFLFTFDARRGGDTVAADGHDMDAARDMIRRAAAPLGWEAPAILSHLDSAQDLYFDRVSQIRMPEWSTGRVALIGDAAACASLLAGEGTSLAMVEAYVLAGELAKAGGDHVAAFDAWQKLLQPMLVAKQDAALKTGAFFVPRNRMALILRDLMMNVMRVPGLAGLTLGRMFRPPMELPDYTVYAP